MFYTYVPSPVGDLLLAGSDAALKLISFPSGKKARAPESDWQRLDGAFKEPRKQLGAYFDGKLRHFDLDYQLSVTAFQQAVLDELRAYPLRRKAHLQRHCRADRPPASGSCRWRSERQQSPADRDSLPPGDRRRRQLDGLWRRP